MGNDRGCANCRWCVKFDGKKTQTVYNCRRHAPVVVMEEDGPKTRWPQVMPDFYCGDWTQRPGGRQPDAGRYDPPGHPKTCPCLDCERARKAVKT